MEPEGLDPSKLKRVSLAGSLVTVEDGDTITVKTGRTKITVRLAGIDAPETAHKGIPGQSGAVGSIALLTSIINKYRSQLELYLIPGAETHGRAVGFLTVGKTNINLELIKAGLAVAYEPKGGNEGVKFGAFLAAQRRAVEEQRGIFKDPTWRATVALNRSAGSIVNNAMVRPERIANDWSVRVRNRAIAGLRSSDASNNAPEAWPGMKPGRPDFAGGRTPFNLDSMAILSKFLFLDIETTGLKAQSVITEAALSQVGGPFHHTALTPGLKWHAERQDDAIAAALAPYESFEEVRAAKALRYRGTSMKYEWEPWMASVVGGEPGKPITMDAVAAAIQAGGMSPTVKKAQIESMKALWGNKRVERVEDFTRRIFEHGDSWMFIHNANFESMQLAAGIPDDVWEEAVRSGRVSGSMDYKNLRGIWDPTLSGYRDTVRELERAGSPDFQAIGRGWTDWYRRLRSMMTGDVQAPSGVKVVDVQDLARSVLHMAGVADPRLAGPTQGMMSQSAIAAIMGLGPEKHLADADIRQSEDIVRRLMQEGEYWESIVSARESGQTELVESLLSSRTDTFAGKARGSQTVLGWAQIMRDWANRRGTTEAVEKDSVLTKLDPQFVGDYFIGGQKVPVDVNYYKQVGEKGIPIDAYMKKRMKAVGLSLTTEQEEQAIKMLRQIPEDVWENVRKYDQGALIGHMDEPGNILSMAKYFNQLDDPLNALHNLRAHFANPPIIGEGGTGAEDDLLAAMTDAVTGVPSMLKNLGAQAGMWWKSLTPKTRAGIGITGAVIGGLGIAGMIRGRFEEERPAQPQSIDLEQYLAQGQMHRAEQEEEARRAGARTAMQAPRLQKNPSRYY